MLKILQARLQQYMNFISLSFVVFEVEIPREKGTLGLNWTNSSLKKLGDSTWGGNVEAAVGWTLSF